MNTWTSRVCAAVLTSLTLAGCEGGLGLTGSDTAALRTAPLGQGAVTLVAPSGFCIDTRSLRTQFALMARCDTLGADGAEDAPLALITATTATLTDPQTITPETLGANGETVVDRADRDGLMLVQLRGTPPNPAFRETYWRAAGQIGDQIVGLTLYEAQDSAPLGASAPRILAQTMQRTQEQTSAYADAAADNSATPPDNNASLSFADGLFE